MPKYIAIAAVTIDGKIAKTKNHMSDWTSKEDKVFMRGLLDKCDVVIVGNNTYKTAIGPLSKRNCIVISRSANQQISKSTRAGLPLPMGEGRGEGSLVYCLPQKSALQKIIRARRYKTIAILGGAQTYSFCLHNNLLDEIYLTIEPIVFGSGINLFADDATIDKKFKLASIKKLNQKGSLLLHYKEIGLDKTRKICYTIYRKVSSSSEETKIKNNLKFFTSLPSGSALSSLFIGGWAIRVLMAYKSFF